MVDLERSSGAGAIRSCSGGRGPSSWSVRLARRSSECASARERSLSLSLCSSVCGALEVLTLYGPFLFRFFYADPIRLVTELDGTRIIGAEASEFLQIVPGALFPSFAR